MVEIVSKTEPCVWKKIPLTLVTQVGAPIGLTGLAFNQLVNVGRIDVADLILNVIGAAILLGEIVGSLTLKIALSKSSEIPPNKEEGEKKSSPIEKYSYC